MRERAGKMTARRQLETPDGSQLINGTTSLRLTKLDRRVSVLSEPSIKGPPDEGCLPEHDQHHARDVHGAPCNANCWSFRARRAIWHRDPSLRDGTGSGQIGAACATACDSRQLATRKSFGFPTSRLETTFVLVPFCQERVADIR